MDQPLPLYLDGERDDVQAVLAATWEAQQQARLPNFTVTMFNPWYDPQSSSRAVMDMAALVDGQLGRLDAETPGGKHLQCYFKIEHSPNPESRITLGEERDPLGMPRLNLDWACDEQDFAGLERGVAYMRREFGRLGLGRVEWPLVQEELIAVMTPPGTTWARRGCTSIPVAGWSKRTAACTVCTTFTSPAARYSQPAATPTRP